MCPPAGHQGRGSSCQDHSDGLEKETVAETISGEAGEFGISLLLLKPEISSTGLGAVVAQRSWVCFPHHGGFF